MTGPVPRYHLASAAALLLLIAAIVARVSERTPPPPVGTRLDTSHTSGSERGAY
jgi:hypothetical protein